MNQRIKDLCADPLFQLNLSIWLAQPQPTQAHCTYPLLYESGVRIFSVGTRLALPPDIRLAANNSLNCQDSVRPELILRCGSRERFCFLECKARSFGDKSSTASQARTLLLVTGPIFMEVLGLGTRGTEASMLCYLTVFNEARMMQQTLNFLCEEIRNAKLEAGYCNCFEIKPDDSRILLLYSEHLKEYLGLVKESPVPILTIDEDTDPRPLYFIPYDPNIEQPKEEQEFCRRVLLERVLSHIICKIGEADIPTLTNIKIGEALNAATFHVYEVWDDKETTKCVRRLVKDFLVIVRNGLPESLQKTMRYEPGTGWLFDLRSKTKREELIKYLCKFKPETLDLSKTVEPGFFDDQEL